MGPCCGHGSLTFFIQRLQTFFILVTFFTFFNVFYFNLNVFLHLCNKRLCFEVLTEQRTILTLALTSSLALALALEAKSLALALEAKSLALALALRVVALTPSLYWAHRTVVLAIAWHLVSFRIDSNIGLLFEISNWIEQFLPFSKVGMLKSFFS